MKIEQADKILAKMCEVEILRPPMKGASYTYHAWWKFKNSNDTYPFPWTINDARCREVVDTWWLNAECGRKITHTRENFHYEEPDGIDSRGSYTVAYSPSHIVCMIKIAEGLSGE